MSQCCRLSTLGIFHGSILPFELTALARILGQVYGQSIAHQSLRPAIILNAVYHENNTLQAQILAVESLQLALHALGQKLKDPSKLDEGDLFTAFLLAMSSMKLKDFLKHSLGVIFYHEAFVPKPWQQRCFIQTCSVLAIYLGLSTILPGRRRYSRPAVRKGFSYVAWTKHSSATTRI